MSLLVSVAVLAALARAADVPYPIVLVVRGLLLGFVPGLPRTQLPPHLVLALFLPPLLYSAAYFSNLHDLRRDLRPITLLAVGLVIATTVVVAVVAHELVDDLPWAAAFALGAIVAPTDALAATAIARRQGVPRRIVSVLEGESLLNDGSALVLYNIAVKVALGEATFSVMGTGLAFVRTAAVGIGVGLVVGKVLIEVRRRLDDVPVEITI